MRHKIYFLCLLLASLILVQSFNRNFITNGNFQSNTCTSTILSGYKDSVNSCTGPNIVDGWFSIDAFNYAKTQTTLLRNKDLKDQEQFFYEPLSYQDLLIPLNFKMGTHPSADDYGGTFLYTATPILKRGVYTLQFQQYLISPQIPDADNLNEYNYYYGLFFLIYPYNVLLNYFNPYPYSPDRVNNNKIQFTFTIPQNILNIQDRFDFRGYNLQVSQNKPVLLIYQNSQEKYVIAFSNFKLYISGCTDSSQNLDMELGYLNDQVHTQICVEKDIFNSKLNCQYFKDNANSQDIFGTEPQFECDSCPSVASNIIRVYLIDSSTTTQGCSDLLITGVDEYKKTDLLINAEGGRTYIKFTPHKCADGYVQSAGRLRIQDNADHPNTDETGIVCIQSQKEIPNIKTWQYNSLTEQYQPIKCQGDTTPILVSDNNYICPDICTVYVKVKDRAQTLCAKNGLVDNCAIYESVQSQTAGPCYQCQKNYNLVEDQAQRKMCISSPLVKDCVYYNVDGTCRTCKNGSPFNNALKICPSAANQLVLKCQKATVIGQTVVRCQVCQSLYVLDYNQKQRYCKELVEYCSNYSLKGNNGVYACIQCVDGYYLLRNKCTKINDDPKCLSYNFASNKCNSCKEGYIPNEDGICQLMKTCYLNQYKNYNGICVNGNKPNCAEYESPNGECWKCIETYRFDEFGKCSVPKKKVDCPPSTQTTRYYIELGECKSTDQICGDVNSDGACKYCLSTDYFLDKGICKPVIQLSNTVNPQSQNLRTIFNS